MLRSIRRIGNVLLIVGTLSLSLTMVSSISMNCGGGEGGCLATALTASFLSADSVSYQPSLSLAEATPVAWTESLFEFPGINAVIQLIGIYTLLTAVFVLIILETLELHYLRRLFHYRKAFRLR